MIPVYIKMAAIALWCSGQYENQIIERGADYTISRKAWIDGSECRRDLFNCLQGTKNQLQAESCFTKYLPATKKADKKQ